MSAGPISAKYRPYPEYKDSGVPWMKVIPSHWKVDPFFGQVEQCKRPNKGMVENNLLSLSFGRIIRKNINTEGGLLPESFETYQIVEEGDEVFRLTDLQNDKRSLRSARVFERGIITSAYLAVTPKAKCVAYFTHLMRSYDTTKVFYSMGGGLRQSLKFEDVRRMPILVPSMDEQTAIADFIERECGRMDRLVEKKEAFIGLLKEKRQALITHAVTKGLNPNAAMKDSGVTWLGQVPKHWKVKKLRYCLDDVFNGTTATQIEYSEGTVPVTRIETISQGKINFDKVGYVRDENLNEKLKMREGDIAFSNINSLAMIGNSARFDGARVLFAGMNLLVFRPTSDLDSKWLFALVSSRHFRQEVESRAKPAINQASVSQAALYAIPCVCPSIDEQRKISDFIETQTVRIDRLIAKTQESIALLKERKTALITAAVTGQIDVTQTA